MYSIQKYFGIHAVDFKDIVFVVNSSQVEPHVYRFEFTPEKTETPYNNIPLIDSAECNKILASKTINFRVIMFQIPK